MMADKEECVCEVCGEWHAELIVVVNRRCVRAAGLICPDCCAQCDIHCICEIVKR